LQALEKMDKRPAIDEQQKDPELIKWEEAVEESFHKTALFKEEIKKLNERLEKYANSEKAISMLNQLNDLQRQKLDLQA